MTREVCSGLRQTQGGVGRLQAERKKRTLAGPKTNLPYTPSIPVHRSTPHGASSSYPFSENTAMLSKIKSTSSNAASTWSAENSSSSSSLS